ncbi:MAG TPA: beta-1,6-N-acetylglucosaminyltransferase [Bacteroidales bacterium]|nr:beta-1,6-N-acetylglucosaminyltransferase [Bacteroidales bacterium]HPS15960.1 beta-1,6-N-acetylglucosaminyltransferase [Bacteroidales bacterium]
MKHGILITAYKNLEQLIEIVNFFDENFKFYIHIDRKSKPDKEIIQKLNTIKKVKFITSKFKINWGGRNHLLSILLLAKEALRNPDLEYFHLISGQDFPIKNTSYFINFFNTYKGKDFLEYTKMPANEWNNRGLDRSGGMDRINYYNFYDVFNERKKQKWISFFIKLQQKINFKRPVSKQIPQFYLGSTWWSLSKETLTFVIDYTGKNKYLIKRLKHTFCSEEIYFQTVIMNSDYSKKVINDNLRYIDWESGLRYGSIPAILDITDLDKINSSDKLFARKIEAPFSDELKKILTTVISSK